jgi:hypothetical protein
MNTINIAYTPWFEKNNSYSNIDPAYNDTWLDLVRFDIEKLDTWKESTSNYKKCPAFINFVDQFWVIRSSIDVEITWDRVKRRITSNLSESAHSMMIKTHSGDFNSYVAPPIIAINNSAVFYSDDNVWIDVLPPFNHIDDSWRLLPASFNICTWQRPVVPTFEMLKDVVSIKRGQPLAYVRFRSTNQQDLFKLIKQEKTSELEKVVLGCSSVKFFQKNLSWKIVLGIIPNKLRPSKMINK